MYGQERPKRNRYSQRSPLENLRRLSCGLLLSYEYGGRQNLAVAVIRKQLTAEEEHNALGLLNQEELEEAARRVEHCRDIQVTTLAVTSDFVEAHLGEVVCELVN